MKFSAFAGFVVIGCITFPIAVVGQSETMPQVNQPRLSASVPRKLPLPFGSLGIGRVGYDWTDASRPDRNSADPKARRELMVYIWYPTGKNPAQTKGAYLPGAHEMNKLPELQNRLEDEFGPRWPSILSGSIFSHSADNAPPAMSPQMFPVILLSHGMGGSGFEYTSLIENLVSHGYVVAAIEHTGSAIAVIFSAG